MLSLNELRRPPSTFLPMFWPPCEANNSAGKVDDLTLENIGIYSYTSHIYIIISIINPCHAIY